MIELPIPERAWVSSPNPVKAQMLKESLKFLWNGTGTGTGGGIHEYICNALAMTKTAETHYLERNELRASINQRIEEYDSYRTWLHSQYITLFEYPDLQDARRRFVLQMIEEFGGTP